MKQPPKTKAKTFVKPDYTMFAQARAANNKSMGLPTNTPATRQDSLDYQHGFNLGLRGGKISDPKNYKLTNNEYSRKGQWEGQNHSFKNRDAVVIAKKVGK